MAQALTNSAGWEYIANVEGEYILEDGEIIDAAIWITTRAGDVFGDHLLHGETVEGRIAHYRARGLTDARCCLYRAT